MLILYNIRRYVMTEKYLNTVYEKIKTANVYDIAIKSPLEYAKNEVIGIIQSFYCNETVHLFDRDSPKHWKLGIEQIFN